MDLVASGIAALMPGDPEAFLTPRPRSGHSGSSNPGRPECLLCTWDKGNHCCQVKMYCPDLRYSVTINMVLYHVVPEYATCQGGCSGTSFFYSERQYTEQPPDKQPGQVSVTLS